MKKFFSFLVTMLIVVSAGAYDCAKEIDYYAESSVDGYLTAVRLSVPDQEVTTTQRRAMITFGKSLVTMELLPMLEEDGILSDWIKLQNDPRVHALNQKIINADNVADVQSALNETTSYMTEKYSAFCNAIDARQAYTDFTSRLVAGYTQLMVGQ